MFSKRVFKMFSALVLLLLLAHFAQSCTEVMLDSDQEKCCTICPAGFHKKGHTGCNDTSFQCTRCISGLFTDRENAIEKCERCNTCQSNGEEKSKECVYNSDIQCRCKKNYYNSTNYLEMCNKCNGCKKREDICSSECGKMSVCNNRYGKHGCKMCKREDCSGYIYKECASFCSPTITTTIATVNSSSAPLSVVPLHPQTTDMHYYMLVILVVLVTILLVTGILVLTRHYLNMEKDLASPTGTPHPTDAGQPSPHTGSFHPPRPFGVPPPYYTQRHSEGMMSSSQTEHPNVVTPLLPETQLRIPAQESCSERLPATVLYAIIKEVPLRRWKEFLRLLSVPDQQLERVELETGLGLGSMEKQYLMLRLWSQRRAAAVEDVFSALRYMDLVGCAHQLQDSLDKLQWSTGAGRVVAQPVMSP